MALNDIQVTFSPHGSFSLFITQSLTCDQSRLCSPAPSHLSSIWCLQQPREENQDPKRTWPAQGLTAQAVHNSAFPLIPNIPALEHFPLVQNPSGLSPQSMRAQEVMSAPGNTHGSLQVTWTDPVLSASLLSPFSGSHMPSGPPLTLAATTNHTPLCPECESRPSLQFPVGNCPTRFC